MDDRKVDNSKPASELDGPGIAYKVYLDCERVIEKLKILNYEKDYVNLSTSFRTVPRHYFASSTNPGEQFFLFTTICGWLIKKFLRSDFPIPQELDEPNTTLSNIVNELKNAGVTVDIIINRLKSGSGSYCVYVLDKLTDLALMKSGFRWKKLNPETLNDNDDEAFVTQTAEASVAQSDDDDISDADDYDEGTVINMNAPVILDNNSFPQKDKPLEEVMESNTNIEEWKLEVDRLAPQLKIYVKQDAKDWRAHLEQMRTASDNVTECMNTLKKHFDTLSQNLTKELERISTRQAIIKLSLIELCILRKLFKVFCKLSNQDQFDFCREASGGVRKLNSTLQQITDDLTQIKAEIEEQGQRNNDAAPILRIKQALTKMENDIRQFDIQIGAVEYSLMQAEVKQRNWHMSRPF
uniref:Intraflagellar transport protein 57 homolog n=1 Tax=Syphacia muris TaxID=451379 RepID=A0A0N5B089_9BILA